jgi:hypothetical protein
MKVSALYILETIKNGNAKDVQGAMQEYLALVDRFYQANEHLMAVEQYQEAKVDFEYFLRLLKLAIFYSADNEQMQVGTGSK